MLSLRRFLPTRPSLRVLSSAISVPQRNVITIKNEDYDSMPPEVENLIENRNFGKLFPETVGRTIDPKVRKEALKKFSKSYRKKVAPTPDKEAWITDFKGLNVGLMKLSGNVFNVPPRLHVIQICVRHQLAHFRKGNAFTKKKNEVSGTSKKPYPQKGRGRARHGSLRNPQFRGGGRAHGPRGTNWKYNLAYQIQQLGMKNALTVRMAQGDLSVVDEIPDLDGNSVLFDYYLRKRGNGPKRSVLIITGPEMSENLFEGTLTLDYCHALPCTDFSPYDIMKYKEIILTKEAVEYYEKSLLKNDKRKLAPTLLPEMKLITHQRSIKL